MEYTLERTSEKLQFDIIKKANMLISKLPYGSKLLLEENYFSEIGCRLYNCLGVGYFYTLNLYDHGDIYVSYWGCTESDVVNNLIFHQINIYYPIACPQSDNVLDSQKKYWKECQRILQIEDFIPPKDDRCFTELYLPYFMENHFPDNEKENKVFIEKIGSNVSQGHRLLFDELTGYFYIVPIGERKEKLYSLGMSRNDAIAWIEHAFLTNEDGSF